MEFAEAEFVLSKPPKGSKVPLREHLEQVAETSGAVPDQLAAQVNLPPDLEPVWNAFCELSETRPMGMTGPGAIPFSELEGWQKANGIRLAPWEIDAIRAVDRLFRSVMHGD